MEHKKSYRIFLVDDDSFLLDMYSLKFKQAGHTVDIAKSGEEALRKLKEGLAPDIMLFDIIMPGIDGFALLENIQKEHLGGTMAKIALSNQWQEGDITKVKALGADGYIVKASAIPSEVLARTFAIIDEKA